MLPLFQLQRLVAKLALRSTVSVGWMCKFWCWCLKVCAAQPLRGAAGCSGSALGGCF